MISPSQTGAALGGVLIGHVRPGRGEPLLLLDPSDGECFGELVGADLSDVDEVVAATRDAAADWRRVLPVERGRACLRIAGLLRERGAHLTDVLVQDAGLPRTLAARDVEVAARYFEFYAGLADKLFGDSIPAGPAVVELTSREPWGVCAVILPFNFPLQLAARDVAPALATGNALVVKAPEQDPVAVFELGSICSQAGVPEGVVTVITGRGPEIGQAIVRHPDVDHVTFTGSVSAARSVLSDAAEGIKPATIELGGKSPHIVFDDADLARAVASIAATTFRPAGQACSAGTRVLVEDSAHDRLVAELIKVSASLRTGPAWDDPDVGPLISALQRDRVLSAVIQAEADGAQVVAGGSRPEGVPEGGFYVAPTVIDQVRPHAAAAREEIFGPVVSVLTFTGEDEAIELANDTEYGLVAGVWTHEIGRALRVAREVVAGQVFVNGYGVGGGVELPFGGFKRSGYGRVKGVEGALEYTRIKSVAINCE
jgi:acyl-CoA reductase-like NAD-dependent aldehyde dehydrogenase